MMDAFYPPATNPPIAIGDRKNPSINSLAAIDRERLPRFEHKAFASLPARHRVVGMKGYDHVFDWFRQGEL